MPYQDIVYVLRMETSDQLEAAFARVLDTQSVSSCIIEPDHLQIRFVAADEVAEELVHRIYLSGGLVWSSRHALSADPPVCA